MISTIIAMMINAATKFADYRTIRAGSYLTGSAAELVE